MMRNDGSVFESVFSSKGVGEPPLTLATAVVCAIRGAVTSYRRDQGAEAGLLLSEHQPEEKMSLGLLLLADRDEA